MKKPKNLTRREARAWLSPIRRCFAEMTTGEVDSIQGYAVTRFHADDDYERTDYCIEGFLGLMRRLCLPVDLRPMEALKARIANGVMLTVPEIQAGFVVLRNAEDALVGIPRARIKDAVLTELIQIEIEQQGIAR